jgi:oxalate decarboxylase/phosphoglucose isomerase-like protein (cupin superfamily)
MDILYYRSRDEATASRIEKEWGSLTWLANKELTRCDDITLGRVIIRRGMSNPRHCHPNCCEVLYLLKGRIDHIIGDETIGMKVGDTSITPPGVMHVAINTGDEDADMIVAYSSGQREFKGET